MVGKGQQVRTHKELQMEHRKVDKKEIFGEPSCIIREVTHEDGLQEVSNILKEEDNQVGELNKELHDIIREFKYEENIDKPIQCAISTTFFGGMLEDPIEEIQKGSLPEALQGAQVVASGMSHHQLRPPEILPLEMETDGRLTKTNDGSSISLEGAMFGETLYKELQDVPKESSNGNYMLDDEAPIGKDMQGLLSGDQVAPIERKTKNNLG